MAYVAKKAAPGQAESPIPALIEREEKKLERVKEAFAAGIDTLEEYRQNKQRILDSIASLRAQLTDTVQEPTERDLSAFAGKLRHTLDTLSDPAASEMLKNLALRGIVEKIIFSKQSGRIEIVYHL